MTEKKNYILIVSFILLGLWQINLANANTDKPDDSSGAMLYSDHEPVVDQQEYSPVYSFSTGEWNLILEKPDIAGWLYSVIYGTALQSAFQLTPYLLPKFNNRIYSVSLETSTKVAKGVIVGSWIYYTGSRFWQMGSSLFNSIQSYSEGQSGNWEDELRRNVTDTPVIITGTGKVSGIGGGVQYYLDNNYKNNILVSSEFAEAGFDLIVVPLMTFLVNKAYRKIFSSGDTALDDVGALVIRERVIEGSNESNEVVALFIDVKNIPEIPRPVQSAQAGASYEMAEDVFVSKDLWQERDNLLRYFLYELNFIIKVEGKTGYKSFAITGGQALRLHQRALIPVAILKRYPGLDVKTTDLDIVVFGERALRDTSSVLDSAIKNIAKPSRKLLKVVGGQQYTYTSQMKSVVSNGNNLPVFSHYLGLLTEQKKSVTVFTIDVIRFGSSAPERKAIARLPGFRGDQKLPVMNFNYELNRLGLALKDTSSIEKDKHLIRLRQFALGLNQRLAGQRNTVRVTNNDMSIIDLAKPHLNSIRFESDQEQQAVENMLNVIDDLPSPAEQLQKIVAAVTPMAKPEPFNSKPKANRLPVTPSLPAVIPVLGAKASGQNKRVAVRSLPKPKIRPRRGEVLPSSYHFRTIVLPAVSLSLLGGVLLATVDFSSQKKKKKTKKAPRKHLHTVHEEKIIEQDVLPDIGEFGHSVMNENMERFNAWKADAPLIWSMSCSKYHQEWNQLCHELVQEGSYVSLVILERLHEKAGLYRLPYLSSSPERKIEPHALIPLKSLSRVNIVRLINIHLVFALRDLNRFSLEEVLPVIVDSAYLCGYMPDSMIGSHEWYNGCSHYIQSVSSGVLLKSRGTHSLLLTILKQSLAAWRKPGTSLILLPSYAPHDEGTQAGDLKPRPYILDVMEAGVQLVALPQDNICSEFPEEYYGEMFEELEKASVVAYDLTHTTCPPITGKPSSSVIWAHASQQESDTRLWAFINGRCISAEWDKNSCQGYPEYQTPGKE